jgi:4-amino-4-deoxy-L-arabinose transferase-like glycosyltransferase
VTTGLLQAGRRTDVIVCLLAPALFCVLTLQHLRLPGPHTDELFTAAPAVNFVEGTQNTTPMQIDPSVVHVAGRPLPLMVMTYVGAVQTFLYVPAFALLGDSIDIVRLVPILLAVAVLWCSYFFWSAFFNRATAILATALLVADPGFIFFAGRDFGPPALALLCKMGGLLLVLRWWRSGKQWYLPGAAFVWGIGLYHKADFLWILAATGIAALLFCRNELRSRLTWKRTMGATAAFAAGAAPFLLMNLLTAGATFRLLTPRTTLFQQVQAFGAAVQVRAGQLTDLMSGAAPHRLFLADYPVALPPYAFVLPFVVLAGFAALVVAAAAPAHTAVARRRRFLALVVGLVFLFSAKTPTTLMPHHLMALYPLLQGAAAAGIVFLLERLRNRTRTAVIASAIALVAVPGVITTQSLYGDLTRTGGTGYWSDAIYELTPFLEGQDKPVALMQWGFTSNLIVLSHGRLTLRRVYATFMEQGIGPEAVAPYIDPSTLYLFYTADAGGYRQSLDALSTAAARQGSAPEEIRSFYQRDGRAVYAVFQLRRLP